MNPVSYIRFREQLKAGVPPEVLCTTCSWDVTCVAPPMMTSEQVETAIAAGMNATEASGPGSQLAVMAVYAGRDTAGEMCPVFLARLTSPRGREVADGIKDMMRGWSEATPGDAPRTTAGQAAPGSGSPPR